MEQENLLKWPYFQAYLILPYVRWYLLYSLATAAWYGMRHWTRSWLKDTKRGGWGWHQMKMVGSEWAVGVNSWRYGPQCHTGTRTFHVRR